jgi:hypothetical protein
MPTRPTATNVHSKQLHRAILVAARDVELLSVRALAELAKTPTPGAAEGLKAAAARCDDALKALLDASRALLVGGDVTVTPRGRS